MLFKLISKSLNLEGKASHIGDDTLTVALLAAGMVLIWVAVQPNKAIKTGVLTLLI